MVQLTPRSVLLVVNELAEFGDIQACFARMIEEVFAGEHFISQLVVENKKLHRWVSRVLTVSQRSLLCPNVLRCVVRVFQTVRLGSVAVDVERLCLTKLGCCCLHRRRP